MKMTFNGKEYEILSVSGRDPLSSFSLKKLQLINAEVTSSSSFSNRLIVVRLLLEGNDRDDTQSQIDKLNTQMFTGIERKKLIFDDMDRYWLATCQSIMTIKEHEVFAELKLTFDCYPLSYDLELSTGGKAIENLGSYSAFPIIEFTLPTNVKNFVCNINGTISKVCLTGENLAGQWKIDGEKRKVYLNGALANDLFDFENSLWSGFELPAGTITTFMTSPADITLTISYRRRWL